MKDAYKYYMSVLVVDDERDVRDSDLNMPGMSGEELLMSLDELNIRPPALVISALAPWKLVQFLHEGIGYLRKPVNASLLLDTVESLIGKGEGGTYETEKAC